MKVIKKYCLVILFSVFILFSFKFNYNTGIEIYNNFADFALTMVKFVPLVFLLIGLFEVWVDRETIERHLGQESGVLAFIWAILLSGTAVGGLYVAFPVAYSLYNKGARLAIIFTYLGAAAVARVPMTLFEISFLGLKFSMIRLIVSIPLIIVSSIGLERYLKGKGYEIKSVSN
ncbi:permease [Orenia marismortui]|uniref:Putative permease n=1 Tax=Orenia marismortui TaxID=46469 RepID=A0A4R8H902_9FIRM|nr:permease [Orenia marismortui]TDX51411.1 putative permease [Orenia marismortui]